MRGRHNGEGAVRAFLRTGVIDGHPFASLTARYALRAVVVVAFLAVAGNLATIMPAALVAVVLLVYALLATMGAMYGVVVGRLHRQYKLAAEGRLSRWNRRWVWRLVGAFVLSLASAFLFVLEAPKWDGLEWAMAWAAIPVYYVVFLGAGHAFKRQFKPRFYKAAAMRASFFAVAGGLCLAYAVASVASASGDTMALADALQNPYRPYANSPCVLLAEADKISAFANGLTAYGLSRVSAAPFVVAVAVKFVVYMSVFMGIVSLLGFCLLDRAEMKGEFQELPDGGDFDPAAPVLKRYLYALAVVAAVFAAGFLAADSKVSEVRAADEYTAADSFVGEQTENLVFLIDEGIEEAKRLDEVQKQSEEGARRIEEFLDARDAELVPLINEYYDRCLDNVDSYIAWYNGLAGIVSKTLEPLGLPVDGMAKDAFMDKVADPAGGKALESRYEDLQEELITLKTAIAIELSYAAGDGLAGMLGPGNALGTGLSQEDLVRAATSTSLELWAPLEGSDAADAGETLLGAGDGVDDAAMREKLAGLIEQARADALAQLDDDRAGLADAGSGAGGSSE